MAVSVEDTAVQEEPDGLSSIPIEIFEQVAQLCDLQGLRALRLTNRDIGNPALRTFTEIHLKERAFFLYYEPGLVKLGRIAEHPHFGRALRTLVFYIGELPDKDILFTPPLGEDHTQSSLVETQEDVLPAAVASNRYAQYQREVLEELRQQEVDKQERLEHRERKDRE